MAENTKITPEVFENLLYLSRLAPEDGSTEVLAGQVEQIVSYFDILKKFDTTDEQVKTYSGNKAVPRSDSVQSGIGQPDLKKMSNEYMDGYFRVPKVLGSGV
ncbi:MAG: Asp-tRNA(Asn)/Glu-tRNA(Gln) amidotransferase subunit GatC [Treponema sp.]